MIYFHRLKMQKNFHLHYNSCFYPILVLSGNLQDWSNQPKQILAKLIKSSSWLAHRPTQPWRKMWSELECIQWGQEMRAELMHEDFLSWDGSSPQGGQKGDTIRILNRATKNVKRTWCTWSASKDALEQSAPDGFNWAKKATLCSKSDVSKNTSGRHTW